VRFRLYFLADFSVFLKKHRPDSIQAMHAFSELP